MAILLGLVLAATQAVATHPVPCARTGCRKACCHGGGDCCQAGDSQPAQPVPATPAAASRHNELFSPIFAALSAGMERSSAIAEFPGPTMPAITVAAVPAFCRNCSFQI